MSFAEHFASPARVSGTAAGLFGLAGLHSPAGLTKFAQTSLVKAQTLAARLQQPRASPPGAQEIHELDELSDTLCRAVDLAAFLRTVHPRPQMLSAAQAVHEQLFGFMSELNTNKSLFSLVKTALTNPDVAGEARKVGEILNHDFLKSGIQFDADPQRQHHFVALSNDISVTGQQFLVQCTDSLAQDLVLQPRELRGLSPLLLAQLTSPSVLRGRVKVPRSQPHLAEHILATADRPQTRQKVWEYLRSAPEAQVARLDQLLADRQSLAELAGYETFADYELGDKMMKNSANVTKFLDSLATAMRPLVRQELSALSAQGGPQAPWDYAYCLAKHRAQMRSVAPSPQFELPAVFEAIATLAHRLFGLRLVPVDVAVGEVWAPEVRRLDVVSDTNERMGIIYLDLLSRPGKQPNPAHFTIQCSRELPSGERQLPIIGLVCSFTGSAPQKIPFYEVQTLFHEMGHALHSMLGQTKLHNVSGTRCATDFVELPSILFEKFASHAEVLRMMSPQLDVTKFLAQQQKIDKVTENWEVWHQLCLSFLDQALHGAPFRKLGRSELVANQITAQHSLYQNVPMDQQYTQQFARFGHLVSYGATYYSYLLDRCLAAMAWKQLFMDVGQWEAGGHKFRDEVLKWGGARDPQESIERLLNRELNMDEVASSLTL